MAQLAEILEYTRLESEHGAQVSEVKCDLGGSQLVTALHYAPPGDDSQPLVGDYAVLVEAGHKGEWVAIAFADSALVGEAGPGERILYSRSAPGVIAAKVHLKADGSISINNDAVTISPSGAITASGAISSDAEVTAMASGPGVKLSTHQHPTGVGPSGPPTPGT